MLAAEYRQSRININVEPTGCKTSNGAIKSNAAFSTSQGCRFKSSFIHLLELGYAGRGDTGRDEFSDCGWDDGLTDLRIAACWARARLIVRVNSLIHSSVSLEELGILKRYQRSPPNHDIFARGIFELLALVE